MPPTESRLRVVLFSFGFKYGMPIDVNMLLDVRFLPNPYWVEELRAETGKDRKVAEYILKSRQGVKFMDHLVPMIDLTVAQNREADKKSLRIGIGCTGGRHRSVAITESIGLFLKLKPIHLSVFHRDISKDTMYGSDPNFCN